MASLSAPPEMIARNYVRVLEDVRAACERAGRDPAAVTICVASKYVGADGLASLLEAGVGIVGENRLQDMIAKQQRFREDFEWHFIGAIQSRKANEIASRVAVVHSLSTESARDRLNVHEGPMPRVLIQVNTSGELSKEGVAPEKLGGFLGGCEFAVSGLMTMPPLAADPEQARPYFRRLADLAAEHGLTELSMGTSQDYAVAVEEGATLIRVGSVLFLPS